MSRTLFGLDIGGANLKLVTGDGTAITSHFPLWKQPQNLAPALRSMMGQPTEVYATMTGELCDCFPNKRDGVAAILAALVEAFPHAQHKIWSTVGRFVSIDEALANPLAVAAANWHALATALGSHWPNDSLLLIDTGSTTTDIIPINHGQPVAFGNTDPARLTSGELVYTGARRTPICALLQKGIAAEFFATAQDAHILLGHIPEEPDNFASADGRDFSRANCHARLCRMVGADATMMAEAATQRLARKVFRKQCRLILNGIVQVVSRLQEMPARIILAGSGDFLAEAAWKCHAASKFVPVVRLRELWRPDLSEAACAHALILLSGV